MLWTFAAENYFVAFLACMAFFAYFAGKYTHELLLRLTFLAGAASSYGFALGAWQDARGWDNTEPLWFALTAGLWAAALIVFVWLGHINLRLSVRL